MTTDLSLAHPLSQFVDADSLSDQESVAESEAESDNGDVDETDLLSALLATEGEAQKKQRSAKKRTSKSDAAKRTSPPNEMFDYIHVAPCRRLFSLAWYDDMTSMQAQQSIAVKLCPTFAATALAVKASSRII